MPVGRMEIVEDIGAVKVVVLCDDEDREKGATC